MAGANTFPHVIPATDLADLASIHVAELDFGTIVWVESVNAQFTLTDNPPTPPDGVTVVSPVPQAAVGKPGAAWQKGAGGSGGGGSSLIVEQNAVPLPNQPKLNFVGSGFSLSNNVGNSSTDVVAVPQPLSEGTTIAALAAISGTDASTVIYVFDTSAVYRWAPGGAAPVDGWTTVAAPGGQWNIQGAQMTLAPLGGGVDDWPRLFGPAGAATAAAAKGLKVVLSPGTFTCASPLTPTGLPSGLTLDLDPGTIINSTLPNGTGQGNTPFFAAAAILGVGHQTTLTTNVVLYSRTLAVADTTLFPPGTILNVGSVNRVAYYTVQARSVPAGAGTLTVERPILWQFLSGDFLDVVLSRPNNIRINGNGAHVTGTGDRAVELAASSNCSVTGLRIDASTGFGSIVASFDIGGDLNIFDDIEIVGGFDAQAGLALESNEGSTITRSTVNHVATTGTHTGVYVVDCRRCTVSDTYSTRNVVGMQFDASVVDGTRLTQLVNSQAIGNTGDGILILNGSDVELRGAAALSNGQHGVHVVTGSTVAFDSKSEFSSNASAGVLSDSTSTIRGSNSKLASNGLDGIQAAGACYANTLEIVGSTGQGCINVTGAGDTIITGCKITPDPTNGALAQGLILGTGHHVVGDCLFIVNGTGTKVGVNLNQAGSLEIDNCQAYGTGGAIGVNAAAGATVRRGSNVNFESFVTPWSLAGGVVANFGDPNAGGQIISNGAGTLQTITAACGPTDVIVLVLTTNAGATRAPQVVAGLGSFGFTAPVADNSTYSWKAVS